MKTNQYRSRGFSLIETLVVIGVLAVIGVIMTALLTNTLRDGNKTELIGNIKQNGERALGQMSDTIRSANNVVCVDNALSPLGQNKGDTIVVSTGGIFTRFRFFPQTSSAANGYIQQDNPPSPADPLQIASLCTQTTYTNPTFLTDKDPVSGVSLQPGVSPNLSSFQLNPNGKGIVNINFYLAPGVSAGSGAQNQVGGSVSFSTSVGLR